MSTLEIDGIVLPTESLLTFDQTYDDLALARFSRTADNSGILRSTGSTKLRTTIRATGWIPPDIRSLSKQTTHLMRCVMVRAIDSATTTVTLPEGRRSDSNHQPIGFAVVGDHLVPTAITNLAAILAGTVDDAVLASVAGSSGYRVHYWPEITAVILSSDDQGSQNAIFRWMLEAEEV